MSGDYLWVWTERRDQVTVLKLRGELDVVTAPRFAVEATRKLRQAPGLVEVDLSFLDFLDCTGGRTLAEVIGGIQPWRLTGVCRVQPAAARLLELIGLDLPALPPSAGSSLSPRGRELLAQARLTRAQSREAALQTSTVMARLANTYAGLAGGRHSRVRQEQVRAAQMQRLSDTARDLSVRYRQFAMYSAK